MQDHWYRGGWNQNLEQEDVQALLKADRLWDFTRIPVNEKQKKDVEQKVRNGGNSWLPYDNGVTPTAKDVNEWSKKGLGHDFTNAYICIKARLEKQGLPTECGFCRGHGSLFVNEEFKKLYEEWSPLEPPEGPGFQLWSTTSEGSPLSPVFKTLDELCEYAEENCTVFGYEKTTKKNWKEMLERDMVHHKSGNNIFL